MAQALAVGTGRFDRVVMGPQATKPLRTQRNARERDRAKSGSSDTFNGAIHGQSGQVGHHDSQAIAHSHRTLHTHPAGPNSSGRGPTAACRPRRCIGRSRRRTPRPAPGAARHEPGLRLRLTAVCCECPLVSLKCCVRPVGGDGCGSDLWSPVEVVEWSMRWVVVGVRSPGAFLGWFGHHTFALSVPLSNTGAVRWSKAPVFECRTARLGGPRTQRNAEERSLELLTTTVHFMACSSLALFGARLCRLGSAVRSRQVAPKSCCGHPGVRAVGSQRGALGDRRPVDRALGGLARDR